MDLVAATGYFAAVAYGRLRLRGYLRRLCRSPREPAAPAPETQELSPRIKLPRPSCRSPAEQIWVISKPPKPWAPDQRTLHITACKYGAPSPAVSTKTITHVAPPVRRGA